MSRRQDWGLVGVAAWSRSCLWLMQIDDTIFTLFTNALKARFCIQAN